MATIVTRAGKGSPLTNNEVDANFTNLNTELGTKANASALASYQPLLGYTPVNRAGDSILGDLYFGSNWLYMSYNGGDQIRMNSYGPGIDFYNQTQGGHAYIRASIGNFVVDARAPIFYDSANTSYYTDPASTSVLNALSVGGRSVIGSSLIAPYMTSSDFPNGTLVATNIDASVSNGDSFIIEITGKSYDSSNPPFKVIAQGYLYNDSIIAISGISYGGDFASYIKVFNDGGVLKFWWPRISYWNSFNVTVRGMNGADNGTITTNRVTSISDSTEPTGTKKVQINVSRFMRGDVSATNSVDLRAPIFYDSANTAYYLNPNSFSQVHQLDADGYLSTPTLYMRGNVVNLNSAQNGYNTVIERNTGNDWVVYGGDSVRAPIFYDSNNTAYYVDPASSTSGYFAGNLSFPNTANIGIRNAASDAFLWLDDAYGNTFLKNGNGGFYGDFTGYHFRSASSDYWAYLYASYFEHVSSVRAPAFYDADNTGYWVDPSGTSNLSGLTVAGRISGSINGDAKALYSYTGANVAGLQYWNLADNSTLNPNTSWWYGLRMAHGDADTYYNATVAVSFFADDFYLRRKVGGVDQTWRRFWHNGDSTISASGDFRAPIFYDSANTGYYLDPNSTSVLNELSVVGNISVGNTAGEAQNAFRIDGYNNDLAIIGSSGAGATAGTSISFRTAPAGGGELTRAAIDSGGNLSMYGGSLFINSGGYIQTNAGGVKWDQSGVRSWSMFPTSGSIVLESGDGGGAFYVNPSGGVRAPIFYDIDNTAFFADPASTSVMNAVRANNIQFSNGNTAISLDNPSYQIFRAPDGVVTLYLGGADPANYYDNSAHRFRSRGGAQYAEINANGAYFPIYYDNNNTAYYVDPASTSRVNAIDFGQAGHYIHSVGDWGFRSTTPHGWIQFGPANTGHAHIYTDRSNFYFNAQLIVNGGSTINTGDIRASLFYDLNDTGYYVDPNYISQFWRINAADYIYTSSDVYGRRFIDIDNQSYVVDPASTSNLWYVQLNDRLSLVKDRGHFTGIDATSSAGGRGQIVLNSGYSDIVIASQTSNVNHGSTLSFTAVNPSDIADYRKFVINQGNWGGSHLLRFGWRDGALTNPHLYVEGGFGGAYDVLGLDGLNKITYAYGQLRTPIAYDLNNTGFYVDPASTSNLSGLTVANTITGSISGNADTVDGRHASYFYPNVTDNGYATGDISGNTAHQRLWGTDSVQDMFAFNQPTEVEYSTDGVNWIATTCPPDVFDGKIYGEWSGMSMNVGNNIGGWRFVRMTWRNFGYRFFSHFTLAHSTNGHSFNFVFYKSDLNGNFSSEAFRMNGISSWPGYTFVKHENVSGWWDTRDIRIVFELNHNNDFPNNGIGVGHIGLMGSYGGYNRLYDWNASREVTFLGASVRAPIYYDSQNTAYYIDAASNSRLSSFDVDTTSRFFGGGNSSAGLAIENIGSFARFAFYDLDFYDWNVGSIFRLDSFASSSTSMRAPIFYDSIETAYYLDPNSTGTSLNVAGSIVAAGNVTAYSDRRVKVDVKTIPNALHKLSSIRGVTFRRTDLADKERVYGGVIAQEIEAVLPEAIFDNGDMKSVDYNATIGLLIEAIKQLKAEVEAIKANQ